MGGLRQEPTWMAFCTFVIIYLGKRTCRPHPPVVPHGGCADAGADAGACAAVAHDRRRRRAGPVALQGGVPGRRAVAMGVAVGVAVGVAATRKILKQAREIGKMCQMRSC